MSRGKEPTEKQFTEMVIALARLHGFVVAHFRAGRTLRGGWRTPCQADAAGFPDLLLCHPGRGVLIAAELKCGKNKLTPAQAGWLACLERAGVPAYCWTPSMWEEIEEVLR